jgi:hypothetical protein
MVGWTAVDGSFLLAERYTDHGSCDLHRTAEFAPGYDWSSAFDLHHRFSERVSTRLGQ